MPQLSTEQIALALAKRRVNARHLYTFDNQNMIRGGDPSWLHRIDVMCGLEQWGVDLMTHNQTLDAERELAPALPVLGNALEKHDIEVGQIFTFSMDEWRANKGAQQRWGKIGGMSTFQFHVERVSTATNLSEQLGPSVATETGTETQYPCPVRIAITSKLVNSRVNEGSAFTLTASFFDDASDTWLASTPTSARYRIDRITANGSPGCWSEVLGWTVLTPSTSNSIAITGAQNAILNSYSFEEPRQVTVMANSGLSTQYEENYLYSVINRAGTP